MGVTETCPLPMMLHYQYLPPAAAEAQKLDTATPQHLGTTPMVGHHLATKLGAKMAGKRKISLETKPVMLPGRTLDMVHFP
jgi:hypothetical protein